MKTLAKIISACILTGNLNSCGNDNKHDMPDYDASPADTSSDTLTDDDTEAGSDTDTDTDSDSDMDTDYDAGNDDSDSGTDSGAADTDTFDFADCTQRSQNEMVANLCDTADKAYVILGNVGADYINVYSALAAHLASYCGRDIDAVSAEDYTDISEAFKSDNIVIGTYDTNKALQYMFKEKIFFKGNLKDGKMLQQWSCPDGTNNPQTYTIIGGDDNEGLLTFVIEATNDLGGMLQAYSGNK